MILPLNRIRVFPWAALLLAVLGLAVAATAAWCVAAWHELASMPPGFERLQYDTAWAFVFGGIALAAHALRLSALGRWCAVVPIVLAALRLIAYGTPGWIDVHPLAGNHWLPYGAGNYNDMGVLTALVFLVLGGALAALGPRTKRTLGSVVVAVLAAIALALASLLLFGAWTGGPFASQWLLLSGGERTAALLFLLLAGGVLALILLRSEDEQRAVRRWLPGIVWFAAFACALVLWQALSLQQAGYVQSSTMLVAGDVKNRIERTIGARIRQLDRLAQRSLVYGFNEEQWQRDANALLGETPELRRIGWAGQDLVVRSVVPTSQASWVGEALRAAPGEAQGLDEALRTHQPALTRLLDLDGSGNKGFIIFAPALAADSVHGVVAAELTGDWLSPLLGERFADYYIALLENGELADAVGEVKGAEGSEWTQEQIVSIANARWALLVTPTREHLQRTNSHLPEAALGLGTVLASLLGLCTYLFQTARRRARDSGGGQHAAARLTSRRAKRPSRRCARASSVRGSSSTRSKIAPSTCSTWREVSPAGIPGRRRSTAIRRRKCSAGTSPSCIRPTASSPPEDELAIAARQGWFEEECWHVRKDGTRYCGDDLISAIRHEDDALQGFSVVTRDATLRIALREQTERSRDFYFALVLRISQSGLALGRGRRLRLS